MSTLPCPLFNEVQFECVKMGQAHCDLNADEYFKELCALKVVKSVIDEGLHRAVDRGWCYKC